MLKINNKEYLIALDLDGTLLNHKQKITFKSKHYLRKINNKNCVVIIATGRPLRTALPFYKTLNINNPLICYNGAHIYYENNQNYNIRLIDKEIIKKIYRDCHNIYFTYALAESLTSLYYDNKEYFSFIIDYNNNIKNYLGNIDENITEDVYNLTIYLNEKLDNKENKEKFKEYIKTNFPSFALTFWGSGNYCDVHIKDVNKASAILEVANKYGINKENIICFGDSMNDEEMLRTYKKSYAMKNATPNLKGIQRTKKDNVNNGVIFELKKYFKNN